MRRVTGSGPHSLDSSYSLPGDCGDLRGSLSFSEPLLARITKHPATAMCKLGRHMSQAQCLAYSQSSPNRSHLYCLVRSSLRHALRPTTGVVQIPGYSHNRAVTLTHGAELSGRNGHSPTPAVNPSTSFQETRASFYPNAPALDSHNGCVFSRDNEAGTFPRPQGEEPGWENGSPSLPITLLVNPHLARPVPLNIHTPHRNVRK